MLEFRSPQQQDDSAAEETTTPTKEQILNHQDMNSGSIKS